MSHENWLNLVVEGSIIFNNYSFTFTQFATITLPDELNWAANTQLFVKEWINGRDSFQLQTSGSSGKPKTIDITKDQMVASASATIQYLNIPNGAKALLCMNPDMIGGRMMLVRALIGQWKLYLLQPSSEPMINTAIEFSAMVPLQVENLMSHAEGQRFLNGIKKLIIGGAGLSEALVKKIQSLECQVFQTFGMTETVSHIALKKLNGKGQSTDYQLIGDNEIKIDDSNKLAVRGSVTKNHWVYTNDIVELTNKGFKWLGRADLVVNSGGVKIQIQGLEERLTEYFNTQVWIWKTPDAKLGEQLVGLTEDQNLIKYVYDKHQSLKLEFPKYHLPKKWVLVKKWVLTPSGKPDRRATLLQNQ